jgi:glutathione synthase/RimK-type ligase-like ATP-grasp enzyme
VYVCTVAFLRNAPSKEFTYVCTVAFLRNAPSKEASLLKDKYFSLRSKEKLRFLQKLSKEELLLLHFSCFEA